MRKSVFAASLIALTVAIAPACATKKFVRTEVGTVNTKVDTLTGTVEETQERTRANEGRIGQVDQRVSQVDSKAEAAGRSAAEARNVANSAVTAAETANSRVAVVENFAASARKLVYEVTLSEDQGNFKFGATELPEEAKVRLDEVVNQLKGE